MKWLFALLLLANGALFAAMQFQPHKAGTEPMSEHTPVNADKIRLISEADAKRQPEQPPVPPAPPVTCMEWGQFGGDELSRAQNALKTLQLGENEVTARQPAAKSGSYWVYIPPLKSRQDANRKVDELKALGISDSFVIQDNSKWRFAVSLGIFSSEEGATKYLAQMKAKGVRSAKATPRHPDDGQTTLAIRSSRSTLADDLEKLRADFPETQVKTVDCGG